MVAGETGRSVKLRVPAERNGTGKLMSMAPVQSRSGLQAGGGVDERRLAPPEDDPALSAEFVSQPSLFEALDESSITHRWFELDQNACFLLSEGGQVMDMNLTAEKVLYQERFIAIARGRLTLGSDRSDAVLNQAIATISGHAPMRRRDFVRGADLDWRAMYTVGVPGQRCVFVSFRPAAPLCERLSALTEAFGLTPAETSVLCALVLGRAPKDIGRDLGISTATVRTHLRAICTKMDVRGISGVLALIVRIS